MAYTKQANHLSFFQPIILVAQAAAEVLREIDIGASSADHGELLCVRNCMVKRVQFSLTSEAASGTSVAPEVVFTKRITPFSATGEVVVKSLTIPSGTAIGKTVYLDIDPVEFAVGDTMELSHVVGTGTPTGMGVYAFICEDVPEVPDNNSDMVEDV